MTTNTQQAPNDFDNLTQEDLRDYAYAAAYAIKKTFIDLATYNGHASTSHYTARADQKEQERGQIKADKNAQMESVFKKEIFNLIQQEFGLDDAQMRRLRIAQVADGGKGNLDNLADSLLAHLDDSANGVRQSGESTQNIWLKENAQKIEAAFGDSIFRAVSSLHKQTPLAVENARLSGRVTELEAEVADLKLQLSQLSSQNREDILKILTNTNALLANTLEQPIPVLP